MSFQYCSTVTSHGANDPPDKGLGDMMPPDPHFPPIDKECEHELAA